MKWLNFSFNRFAPGKTGSGDGQAAPKSKNAQEFDELFDSVLSMTGLKLTGARLQQILKDADTGDCSGQAALIDVIQEAEPVIGAHLESRKRAALAVPWRIEGGSDKDRADITRNLEHIGFQKLRKHALDGIAHGYAAAALLWAPGGSEITGWEEIHATRIIFDGAGNPGLITLTGDKSLADWHPNQYLTHIHKSKPGLPCRGSLLRTLIWMYFFKFYGIRDYARYIERFGIPFVLAKLSDADFADNTKTARIISAMRAMGSSGVGVVTKATDIEPQAVSAGGKAEFFNWFEYIDDTYALTILGQLASTKESNGMSNGDLQSGVKDDLTASDCELLEETLNNSIIQPMDIFRNGRKTGLYLVLDSKPAEDLLGKATLVTTLADSGYRAKRKWVEETFEIPLEEIDSTGTAAVSPTTEKLPNKKSLETAQKSPQTPNPSNDAQKTGIALSDAPATAEKAKLPLDVIAREEIVSQLTENTLRQLFVNSDVMTEFFTPLQAEIRNSFAGLDPDDPELVAKFTALTDGFFQQYPSMYEAFDSSKLEAALSGAMLAANINGYQSAKNLMKGAK